MDYTPCAFSLLLDSHRLSPTNLIPQCLTHPMCNSYGPQKIIELDRANAQSRLRLRRVLNINRGQGKGLYNHDWLAIKYPREYPIKSPGH